MEQDNAVHRVLTHLLSYRKRKPYRIAPLAEADIVAVIDGLQRSFQNEPTLISIDAPVCIAGDTHGQFFDLLRIFELGGYPPKRRYVFLGDYVDRGRNSIETFLLIGALRLRYPDCVAMLRGNHEDASLNRVYGFYDECKRKYNVKLWKRFTSCFDWMPIAATVSKKIFCMHGGLSPDLQIMSQIQQIERPLAIPDSGIMCDLLWADPDPSITGWAPNDRGVSYVFGANVIKAFLKDNKLDLICRAHQVVEDGYEFFADRGLVTVFSAPNYDSTFQNRAAVLKVDENLVCSFLVLAPVPPASARTSIS